VLIDLRHSSHITNVCSSIRKAECGSDHYLILLNLWQRIKIEKQRKLKTSTNINLKSKVRKSENRFSTQTDKQFPDIRQP
jgi:hypothetical protein